MPFKIGAAYSGQSHLLLVDIEIGPDAAHASVVNGGVVDTGCARTMLSWQVLAATKVAYLVVGWQDVIGVGGSAQGVPIILIPHLVVGGVVQLANWPVTVGALPGQFSGLLGADVFARCGSLSVFYDATSPRVELDQLPATGATGTP